MKISERITGTIENWQTLWKDKLRGWMSHWAKEGVERLFDDFEPELRDEIKPSLERLKEIEGLPDDLKAILNKATEATSFIQFAAILPYLIAVMMGFAMGSIAPASRIGGYQLDKLVHSYRLDPGSIITAWRRDKTKYEGLFDDLKEQGWDDDRIETLKFVTLFMPSASDIVSWYAREVYEPDMIAKYGLDSELPTYAETDFPKIGVDAKQATNYWRAHWVHASWMQVVEMLHRKLITETDVYEWFRLVEIPPYWRDLLIKTAYTWPTRVDVRRWWDMRTIDEARLTELYEGMGYRGKNLEDYIKWTKVYVDFPMMMTRFKNGWITEDDIRSWLRGLEIPEDRITQFIEEKTKPEKPAQVETDRLATATEIMKGVKKGVITWEEGIEMLEDLRYDRATAEFKLNVYIGVAEGSPESYMEFKQMTQLYRKAIGLEAHIPPAELQEAEAALKEAEASLKEAEAKGVKGADLAPYTKAVSDATYRYRQLLIKWKEEKE